MLAHRLTDWLICLQHQEKSEIGGTIYNNKRFSKSRTMAVLCMKVNYVYTIVMGFLPVCTTGYLCKEELYQLGLPSNEFHTAPSIDVD